MEIDPSSIDSPLALIALFVAMIELFLLYPLARLEGTDRSRIIWFIIGYPIFIAVAFFGFLWFKPVNLYSPQILPENLQQALLPEVRQEAKEDVVASVAPINSQLKLLEDKISYLSKDIAALQDNVGSAKPTEQELAARKQIESNFAENSKYKVLVFYRQNSIDRAELAKNMLLEKGYQSAAIRTDFSELSKITPESGKISIVYTERGQTKLQSVEAILNSMTPKPNVVPNFRATSLSRGDMQLFVF